MEGRARAVFVLVAAAGACFPAYAVSTGSDAGPDGSMGEGGSADATDAGSAEGAVPEGAAQDAGDAMAIPELPSCGDMSGLQANAPWPMHGYCPGQRRRSPLMGPDGGPPPRIHWQKPLQVDATFSPLVMADGTVLTFSTPTSTDGMGSMLSALKPNGDLAWSWTPPSGEDIVWPPAIGADGVVYLPCVDGIYGVIDGGVQVSQSADPIATRGPLVVGPGPVLYVDDSNRTVWAVYSGGAQRWMRPLDDTVDYMTPMFGVAGTSTIYQTTTNGELWAITPAGGTTKISTALGTSSVYRVMAAPDGNLRITTDDHALLWSVTPDGGMVWQWPRPDAGAGGDQSRLPAVSDDSFVYFGLESGNLIAIDPNGNLAWSTTDQPLCNAITLGADGILYTGCDDGLRAYAPDGGLLWKLGTFDAGLDYSIVIGSGNVLYVTASDGNVYAVGP